MYLMHSPTLLVLPRPLPPRGSRLSALELALKQTGSESAKLAADIAQRAAVAEGSNAGIVKVGVLQGG